MSARAMLARIAKLERSRAPSSPFVLAYGSLEAWEAECRGGMDAGQLDARDLPVVMMAVERWHRDAGWAR